jgi:integration host factor subunit alpha
MDPSPLSDGYFLSAREVHQRDELKAHKPASESEQEVGTLTKAELAELLFQRVGLNKREAKDMVETFFEEIRDALVSGQSVKLSGFGSFLLRDKPQRPGRNPRTGEAIPISARRVVTFHASQKLKALIDPTLDE